MQYAQLLGLAAILLYTCVVDAERAWAKQKHWRLRNMPNDNVLKLRKGDISASKSGPVPSKSNPLTIKPSTTRITTTMTTPRERNAHIEKTLPIHEDAEAEDLELGMSERLDEKRFQDAENSRANAYLQDGHIVSDGDEDSVNGPCRYVHCSAGRTCEVDDAGEAQCSCVKKCPEDATLRTVCTNYNETWPSDCEVYQQRCLCLDGSEHCRGPRYYHIHVEYYGVCRKKRGCNEKELKEYPQYMREWLFSKMREQSARRELPPRYLALAYQTQSILMQRWANTAIWKWCDIRADDTARFVSVHELYPISASLLELGHCAPTFVEHCDEDSDHRITISELAHCLKLLRTEVEDRCQEFAEDPSIIRPRSFS